MPYAIILKEKPGTCKNCPVFNFMGDNLGLCVAVAKNPYDGRFVPSWCPIVEIPEPEIAGVEITKETISHERYHNPVGDRVHTATIEQKMRINKALDTMIRQIVREEMNR